MFWWYFFGAILFIFLFGATLVLAIEWLDSFV